MRRSNVSPSERVAASCPTCGRPWSEHTRGLSGFAPICPPKRSAANVSRCEDVTFDMGDGSYEADLGWWEGGGIGSLIWNPKGGEGHVLVAEVKCGDPVGRGEHPNAGANCGCDGYFGPCEAMASICECGEDNSWRDHHYRLLRRA